MLHGQVYKAWTVVTRLKKILRVKLNATRTGNKKEKKKEKQGTRAGTSTPIQTKDTPFSSPLDKDHPALVTFRKASLSFDLFSSTTKADDTNSAAEGSSIASLDPTWKCYNVHKHLTSPPPPLPPRPYLNSSRFFFLSRSKHNDTLQFSLQATRLPTQTALGTKHGYVNSDRQCTWTAATACVNPFRAVTAHKQHA